MLTEIRGWIFFALCKIKEQIPGLLGQPAGICFGDAGAGLGHRLIA